jgi:cation-transporting ATPase E
MVDAIAEATSSPVVGLSQAEVVAARARGDGNDVDVGATRSVREIIADNAFNSITVVLVALGLMLIAVGEVNGGLINVGFMVAIVFVGSFQEILAKRRLDEIALLITPKVTVRRDNTDHDIGPDELVLGDVVAVEAGDQIVVDGVLLGDTSLEVDEALLTGEADSVRKEPGDQLHSGSYCVGGTGLARTTAVGANSYANTLTTAAKKTSATQTPLQRLVDVIIRILVIVAVFFSVLFIGQGIVAGNTFANIVEVVAVTATIIPSGLFLIFAATYSMGAARLTKDNLLVQQLNTIESLSNVDVLCTDKTGTLTANRIRFAEMLPLDSDLFDRVGDFAHSASSSNATNDALISGLDGSRVAIDDEVPFTSARKWSGLSFGGGSWVLGAVEMVEPLLAEPADYGGKLGAWTSEGRRVLLFAGNPDVPSLHGIVDRSDGADVEKELAVPPLTAIALISMTDELRPEAKETVLALQESGVRVKVISGDSPETVASLARQVGLPQDLRLVSGPELAAMTGAEFEDAAANGDIFGRISPDQKERLVTAHQNEGHCIAMIGDGVNDTLALKKADVGIAMESGSSAARGVADMVLLGDSFAAVRPAIAEGRRIITGMGDILSLTLTRSATMALMAVGVMIMAQVFPFNAGAQTIYGMITISIPTLFIALWAKPEAGGEVTLAQLASFIAPTGLTNLLFGSVLFIAMYFTGLNLVDDLELTADYLAEFEEELGFAIDVSRDGSAEIAAIFARTSLVVFLIVTGLITTLFVQPPTTFFASPEHHVTDDRRLLLVVLGCGAVLAVVMGTDLRSVLSLSPLPWQVYAIIAGTTALWTFTLAALLKNQVVDRALALDTGTGTGTELSD